MKGMNIFIFLGLMLCGTFNLQAMLKYHSDYYNALGVAQNATPDEIKAAYQILARKYDPSQLVGEPEEDRLEIAEMFKEINTANETLSDPQKRAEYDKILLDKANAAKKAMGEAFRKSIAENMQKAIEAIEANSKESLYNKYINSPLYNETKLTLDEFSEVATEYNALTPSRRYLTPLDQYIKDFCKKKGDKEAAEKEKLKTAKNLLQKKLEVLKTSLGKLKTNLGGLKTKLGLLRAKLGS